ncbi:metal-dependent hydrolase [Clostridium estertheticum]|uniref:metal-dependent hydrolase n=1 Tax=Clostridium estertheticum TaxID=238834 RepID=UPI001CF30CB2|nr:metal-dependent hydrolase [Clostridium estertheticum]MCB2309032.1 metal-dependent hydrolase [Clostridium estertheticum]MCB2346834.1 metal-dependent hydrolase [Clostridium estertheticum]MCB2351854.1 metal-dependent hydrolase [Clostridium estertheticum]WAG48382.1 metal-dependent hydrolase [Clostridium estertheticum]
MTKRTHIAVGIAVTLPLLNLVPRYAFVGILGSIIADWDLLLGIKHRTITHSLLALILVTLATMVLNFNIGLIIGFNYLTHLLLDSCTKTGVPFLYPFNKKYYGSKLVKTGGVEDLSICLLSIFLIFI